MTEASPGSAERPDRQVDAPAGPPSPWLGWVLPVAVAIVMAVAGWLALKAVQPVPVLPAATVEHLPAGRPAVSPADRAGSPSVRAMPPSAAWVPPAELRPRKAPLRLSTALLLTMRGKGERDEFLRAFGEAIEPYKRDDFVAAADALGALEGRYPGVPAVTFYRGVSLLLAGRTADATTSLSKTAEIADEELAIDARWYLVLAHAQAGERGQAATSARALCGDAPSGEQRRRACHAAALLGAPGVD